MAIDGGKQPSAPGFEDFVAFQARIDPSETGAQVISLDALGDITKFVSGRQTMFAYPTPPTGFAAMLFEFVEAANAANEHGEQRRRENEGGDHWIGTGIAHRPPVFAQTEDFISVSEKSC